MMTLEQKRIWYEWRKMYFRSRTLVANIDRLDEWEDASILNAINGELTELNAQMAELEDENDPWLPELIANEL